MVGCPWLKVASVLAVSIVGLVPGQVPIHPDSKWRLPTYKNSYEPELHKISDVPGIAILHDEDDGAHPDALSIGGQRALGIKTFENHQGIAVTAAVPELNPKCLRFRHTF